jgi:hypothetical protein
MLLGFSGVINLRLALLNDRMVACKTTLAGPSALSFYSSWCRGLCKKWGPPGTLWQDTSADV